ncbi:MAG: GAF domain-containing protein [Proteobacteria bacterium]|nr:GAF domain-containing protein [Pseudomonadota bacterium]
MATFVLSELEDAVQKGWLEKDKPGFYELGNIRKRQEWLGLFSRNEKDRVYEQLLGILVKDGFDNQNFNNLSRTLTPYFLGRKNDLIECQWLMKLGRICLKDFRAKDAFDIFTKVLNDLLRLDGREVDSLFGDAAIQYAKLASGRQHTGKILSILDEAANRAKRLGNEDVAALLLMQMAKNEMFQSRPRKAQKYMEQARATTEKSRNAKATSSMITFHTLLLYWQGRFTQAVENYEGFVATVERYPKGEFPLLAAAVVGHCYAQTGEFSQGIGLVDAIRTQCEKAGNHPLAAHVLLCLGANMIELRQLEEAVKYLEVSAGLSKDGDNEWVRIKVKLLLAYTYHLAGDNKKAGISLREYLAESGKIGMLETNYTFLLYLFWAVEHGFLHRSEDVSLENEINRALEGGNVLLKGVAYRFQAMLQEERNCQKREIVETLKNSLVWLEESGHRLEIAKTYVHMARQYSLMSRKELVKKSMRKVSVNLQSYDASLLPDDIRSVIMDCRTSDHVLKEMLALSQKMTTIGDEKVLLRHIISTANRISGAERGAIFLVQEDEGRPKLLLKASKNLSIEQIESPGFKSSMQMVEKVAISGKGSISDEVEGQPSDILPSDIIQARICVPMIVGNKTVGVMYHDNRILSSIFKEADLDLLAYFASQSAIALDMVGLDRVNRLKNERLREEKLYYKEQHIRDNRFSEIKGESQGIKKVLSKIDKVADSDSAVLILGETGVGKELVARAIHRKSSRGDNPYITVHCSALPDNLISSELFGHEKGAYTGADRRRIGRFELADKGTLFLDELGDIALDIQIKLLRVLQSKEFERVGGTEIIRSDFRIISATNQDLERKCETGEFRRDLFYRINVFSIVVPPLRERKEDVPLLAQYFLENHSGKTGKIFYPISDSAMDVLMEYDWPGNVRELENIIERGTILSSAPNFEIPNLEVYSRKAAGKDKGTTLEDATRNHILWALNKKGWKIRGSGGTAEFLNVKASTLTSKMIKLGIERPEGLKRKIAT